MIVSPDVEKILEAINIIKGGASIVPEDIDSAVSHVLSTLPKKVRINCLGLSPEHKRAFLLGYAACMQSPYY